MVKLAWRAAALDDVDTIAAMAVALYEEHPGPVPMDAGKVRRTVAALTSSPALGRVLIAHDDDGAAGYVILTNVYSNEFDGVVRIIDELYLAPRARSQGAGSEAMRAVEADSRRENVRALMLEVDLDNPRAKALYERLGFSSTERNHLRKLL